MKVRTILYGYCYVNGIIKLNEEETKIVKEMKDFYLNGKSLLGIATNLNSRGIEYMHGVIGWNKSRIMRLLEDKRYVGTEEYPAIFSQEEYDEIQKIRESKNTQKEMDKEADIFKISIPVYCTMCGERMRRRLDQRRTVAMRWACQNKDCGMLVVKNDDLFIEEIKELVNGIIENPDKVIVPTEKAIVPSERLKRLSNEVSGMLYDLKIDRELARKKLLERLSKQYEEIDFLPCEAAKLRDIFIDAQPMEKFNSELFLQTVDEIKLYKDGTVGLILENKQEVRNGGAYGAR